jgi:hypothetical protein
VHESRKPKMCPYHSEVTDISLAAGDPQAGFNAMAQHAWSAQALPGRRVQGRQVQVQARDDHSVILGRARREARAARQERAEREEQQRQQAADQ